jgi:hypothetical protein
MRDYIRKHLSYRFAVLSSFVATIFIENLFINGYTLVGKPSYSFLSLFAFDASSVFRR